MYCLFSEGASQFRQVGQIALARFSPNGQYLPMRQTVTRKSYFTDLTDAQWELLEPLLQLPDGGAPKTTDLREAINGILYRLRTGCQWRLPPHDFPPEGTVRRYFADERGEHFVGIDLLFISSFDGVSIGQ